MTLLNDEIYGLYEALYELKEKNEISFTSYFSLSIS